MTTGEALYLGLVILTMVAFAGALAGVGWWERSWAKKNGK